MINWNSRLGYLLRFRTAVRNRYYNRQLAKQQYAQSFGKRNYWTSRRGYLLRFRTAVRARYFRKKFARQQYSAQRYMFHKR